MRHRCRVRGTTRPTFPQGTTQASLPFPRIRRGIQMFHWSIWKALGSIEIAATFRQWGWTVSETRRLRRRTAQEIARAMIRKAVCERIQAGSAAIPALAACRRQSRAGSAHTRGPFIFSVKIPQVITHEKLLLNCDAEFSSSSTQ